MSDNKVLMFPLLKRSETEFEIDGEREPSDEAVDGLADHYVGEIVKHMFNHNFEDNEDLMKDMQFVSEFLKSAMYRNLGKYHHLQEIVDDMTASEDTSSEMSSIITFEPDDILGEDN